MYIIGDVHGCYKTLLALVDKLPKDSKIVFVGDLLDRGSNSKDVIKFVRENNYDCVLGTHEKLALSTNGKLYTNGLLTKWGQDGGIECMKSYQDDFRQFADDYKWMSTLPHYLIYDNLVDSVGRKLLITHACALDFIEQYINAKNKIDNSVYELDSQTLNDFFCYEKLLVSNRKLSTKSDSGYFNIFGHTPIDRYFGNKSPDVIVPKVENGVIIDKCFGYANIDTGAVYKDERDRSILSAIEFPSLKVVQQANIENF
ncbi:MAG: hypothetical protein RL154_242 [Pseudomonadota bacterium]|jgi:serine/threonine protein phosphatase 1